MADKINKPMSEATIQELKQGNLAERETEKRQREEEDEDDATRAGESTAIDGAEIKGSKRRELSPSIAENGKAHEQRHSPSAKGDIANEDKASKIEPQEEASTQSNGAKQSLESDNMPVSSEKQSVAPSETYNAETPVVSETVVKDAPIQSLHEPSINDTEAVAKPKSGFGSASGFASASGFGSTSAFASAPGSSSGFNFGSDQSKSSAGGFGSLLQQSGTSTFGSLLDKQEESDGEQEEDAVDDEQYVAVRGLERTTVPTGEEGERCIHSVRAKLYAINPEAANEGWKERGVGTLRVLDAVKADEKKRGSRLVMRADAVLRVILNMPLRSSYKLEDGGEALGEKTMKLFGVEDGKGVWIAMRVGSEQAASELKSVLGRCLESDAREREKVVQADNEQKEVA